ncbi:MAG TPA: hypothetical protein VHE61_16370 [Opitutaceae bacterium]|nr:hypothetical protein [Opitutaceae bacterium]
MPAPGSAEEARWFAFATDLARSMTGRIDILGLVNEVFIDTMPQDLEPANGGDAPMVVFLERLADHLQQAKLEGRAGAPLVLYAGGFTRLDLPRMQRSPTVAALAHWLSTSPEIAGVDLHLHQPTPPGASAPGLLLDRGELPR